MRFDDTIAAISSSVGAGRRIIVRISGPGAIEAAGRLLPGWRAEKGEARRTRLGVQDLSFPVWVYSFVAPHSYSGEDLVELHLPGNAIVARWVLESLVRDGCRSAEPGEFTARAYFHGRMDLSEAEGVAATISAQNEEELAAARGLLSGELARRLRPVMDELAQTLALIEVGIDFSEEEVTILSGEETARRIEGVRSALTQLLADSVRLERLTHEPRIVLTGRPNAGKSTLLNALAGHERAVVSPVEGTTRDVLSAEVILRRGIVRLIDAAGVGEKTWPSPQPSPGVPGEGDAMVEITEQMRRRAMRAVKEADVVVMVRESGDTRPMLELPRRADLIVASKRDLVAAPSWSAEGMVLVSATRNEGLAQLRESLDALAFGRGHGTWSIALNSRHIHGIEEAQAVLSGAAARPPGAGAELIALDLREALDALGQILGTVTPEDLLGRIFSAFCIGK